MAAKVVLLAIKDLHSKLFVRVGLNQDHALYLAELMEGGVKFPPIKVTSDLMVIDGRHRIEAYELNNRSHIEAEIINIDEQRDIIAEAYKANVGGALPPTKDDTEHTISLLLDCGESMKRIGELLGLPSAMARKYANSVKSKVARQKLMNAATAVTDSGLTMAKAAEQYGVDPDKLKDVLTGRRKRQKEGVGEIQRNITRSYKSLAQKNAILVRSLIEKHEDGDVTESQVREIFAHIEQLQKRATRAISDWKKRFETGNKEAVVDEAAA